MREKLKSLKNQEYFYLIIFGIVSVFFAAIFKYSVIGSDDEALLAKEGNHSLVGLIVETWNEYMHWSSRFFVNTWCKYLLYHSKILWMVFMGISLLGLLIALYKMFIKEYDTVKICFLLGIAFLFPWEILTSAGWIATTGSYFSPPIFGIIALVPIIKLYEGR